MPLIGFVSVGRFTAFALVIGIIAAGGAFAGPSGVPMPVGDIPGWRQVFADDFTTNVAVGSFPRAVSSKWSAYPDGWKDTSKHGTYYPSKVVSIRNGVMNLYIHTENGIHMVSAPVPIIPGAVGSDGGLLYGRYVIRFKSDAIPGYKTAWLLWPDSETWPRDGEIDFPEGNLNGMISAFMHHQNGTSGGDQDAFSTSTTYTSWHTAVIEWTASSVNFILDGVSIGKSTSRIPNTPMHWVIQTETALDGSTPSDSASGNVQIDWVAVYVPNPIPPAANIAALKAKPADSVINLTGPETVIYAPRNASNARSTTFFYVGESRALGGLKVVDKVGDTLVLGNQVSNMIGYIRKPAGGEVYLELDSDPTGSGNVPIRPLGMSTRSALTDPRTPTNAVTVWGEVKAVNGTTSFAINDGFSSNLTVLTNGVPLPLGFGVGKIVTVTGVLSQDRTVQAQMIRLAQ